ncbi:hypothetical protein VAPA_2c12990 [Variovorax paradoxus B4]|uniref:Transposase n=1 Tax=Variovorax paradoxus B4 TaxID=1246301 RepID=T1XLT9_VARPD|nr:hypothetical protein VAPA_2c12990 [Variovorax paradoxus B4]
MRVARYGQAFKDRAVARLLPPESSALEVVAREVGIARRPPRSSNWSSTQLRTPAADGKFGLVGGLIDSTLSALLTHGWLNDVRIALQ